MSKDKSVSREQSQPAPEAKTSQEDSNSEKDELAIRLEALQAELDEANSMRLRAVADYQNLRRRTENEKVEMHRYASEGLIRDLLPVLDAFDRAALIDIESPDESQKGLIAIERLFRAALEARGLKKIPTVGKVFDEVVHEAIIREPDEELESGTVSLEIESGYLLHDHILRPAKVKVVANT